MITKAEAVMAALDVNFIPANCCVFCREPKMNFAAAAINPRGERKGICGKCGRDSRPSFTYRFDPLVQNRFKELLDKIRTGYYD